MPTQKEFSKPLAITLMVALFAIAVIALPEKRTQPEVNNLLTQTYSNEKYGYSISYPDNWYVDTIFSNDDYTERGPESILMGGDTYISNYSEEQLEHFKGTEGEMSLPEDYMQISIMFEKIKPNTSLDQFAKTRYTNPISSSTVTNTTLSSAHAIRYEVKDIQDGLGGNARPNIVDILTFNKERAISIGYGYNAGQDTVVAEKIINSFTFTDK